MSFHGLSMSGPPTKLSSDAKKELSVVVPWWRKATGNTPLQFAKKKMGGLLLFVIVMFEHHEFLTLKKNMKTCKNTWTKHGKHEK